MLLYIKQRGTGATEVVVAEMVTATDIKVAAAASSASEVRS